MKKPPDLLTRLVLARLAQSESRLLSLTVTVRKQLGDDARYRGNLPNAIQLALRQLIKTRRVTDTDGCYSLQRNA